MRPMARREFSIHGETVRLTTDCPVTAAAADEVLGVFDAADGTTHPLEIELHAVPSRDRVPVAPAAGAEPLRNSAGEQSGYQLFKEDSGWTVDFGPGGLVRLALDAARAEGWLVTPESHSPDWAASFVRFCVIELLRLRGLYAVHSAGLEKNGRGILIAAPGGRGKTTSCLSLVRGGYRCLSDDHPLLRDTPAGPEMLPFPGRVSVTDRTVAWFPELAAAQDGFRRESRKRSFRLEDVFPLEPARACRPDILVIPQIVDWPESSIEPLPKSRALEKLLPQTLLVLDRALAARQFQVLSRLVRQTDCYRLNFGEDVLALPGLFDRLLLDDANDRSKAP